MKKEKTTYPNPNRPPKKYPQKDLHGRARAVDVFYKDFRRFQAFGINVFGWDMILYPEHGGGGPANAEHPALLVATGPAQGDFEAKAPGYIGLMAFWDPDAVEKCQKPRLWMEIHSDPEIKAQDTVAEIVAHGATLLEDNSNDPGVQPWALKFVVADPLGNQQRLWKCSPSRTWEELETQRDAEE